MERFFLHLHERGSIVTDMDGIEYANLDAAYQAAINGARDMMADDVRQGRLWLSCHIEIEDRNHQLVARIPFRDALTITDIDDRSA